jgi:hypothetical protein
MDWALRGHNRGVKGARRQERGFAMRQLVLASALLLAVGGCTSLPQMSDWWPQGSTGAATFGGAGPDAYQLRLESDPPGAQVSGAGAGCTAPCTLSLNGPATLEFALAGYTTAVVDVSPPERLGPTDNVDRDARLISVALEPAPPAPAPVKPQKPRKPQRG